MGQKSIKLSQVTLNEMNKSHKEIAAFYDKKYYKVIPKHHRISRHLNRLASRLKIGPTDNVLDIACGTGHWLKACGLRGAKVSGIDISEKAINACKNYLAEGNFFCQPAETLPFADNTFDVVTCLGSLEHFLDQEKALSEMRRVAKKEARIVILVPNSDFLTYKLGLYSGTDQKSVQETIRSLDEWSSMITRNGLNIISCWRDLHILSPSWIIRKPYLMIPARLAQALLLPLWPLRWQYQVYHWCKPNK